MSEFTDPIDRRTEALQKSLATATRRNKRQAVTIATLRKALEAVCEEYDNCWHDEDGFGKLERTVREARAALGNSTEKEKP